MTAGSVQFAMHTLVTLPTFWMTGPQFLVLLFVSQKGRVVLKKVPLSNAVRALLASVAVGAA